MLDRFGSTDKPDVAYWVAWTSVLGPDAVKDLDQPAKLAEVVLVAANSDEHSEIARFKSLEGKTWNHPVIAHGRLYVRNAKEIACYQLQFTGPG